MKTINLLVLVTLTAAMSAYSASLRGSFQTELKYDQPLQARAEAPNELVRGPTSYSGIAVQLFAKPQPLQLVNPLAPESFGNGEQNVVRDPITHQVVGLKIFSIDF